MTLVDEYIKQLNEVELLALQIAKEDLESSFSIDKSIGFLKWKKQFYS